MRTKLLITIPLFVIIIGLGLFLANNETEKAQADPPECTNCYVTCERENNGNCKLKGEFCLDCGEIAPTLWYRVHGHASWTNVNLVLDSPECTSPCEKYKAEVEVDCGEFYDWRVTCGDNPTKNIQCEDVAGITCPPPPTPTP